MRGRPDDDTHLSAAGLTGYGARTMSTWLRAHEGTEMNAGYGLAVRWSLTDAPGDVAEQLREYVVGTSMANFMFLDGLAFKTLRMREGEWF